MGKTTGYKGMLRDRLPQVVDYALKWQKAKERWIDHAYRSFIKLYCDSNERYHTTRIILGIAKYYREFEFDKSIDWDNLMPEETIYWQRVSSWVDWFRTRYTDMNSVYNKSLEDGKDEFDIKVELINRYLSSLLPSPEMTEEEKRAKYEYVDKLVDFLIKCFRKSILIKLDMLNVFSDNRKQSNQIRSLQQCAGGILTRELFAGPENEPLYILKPKAIDLLQWVNRKILFELPKAKTQLNAQWIGVRIRIATNMLNKLEAEGILTKEISIEYHRRLVSNVRRILGNIYTEDLPFLGCKRNRIRIPTAHK